MDLLLGLAEAAGLEQKRAAMFNGDKINSTENRAVYHVALRAPRDANMCVDGKNVIPDVHEVLDRISAFSAKVRAGEHKGATGKAIKNVISIGIGGSYLGPEFVYEALRTDSEASVAGKGRVLRFLANVDPVDVARAVEGLDPEETMVIVVSKTFTTAETMLNARTLKSWLLSGMKDKATPEDIAAKHIVAVSTSVPLCEAFGINADNVFGFWDWVGGRLSVWSAVGMFPLSLHYGYDVMAKFLAGGHEMDKHFLDAPPRQNLPVIMGLLGVWNSTFMGLNTRVLLPYSQALLRFAAHIQQVDMESNGKRVNLQGETLPFDAGEINFGEPGTNGQHSFYQLVHQGRTMAADFIGYCKSPTPVALDGETVSNHDELMANFFAQPDALAYGKGEADLEKENVPEWLRPHKTFPGNRPSMSLLFPALNAHSLGQLLAIYEHRTAVQVCLKKANLCATQGSISHRPSLSLFAQGFIWGINSFDQWVIKKQSGTADKRPAANQSHPLSQEKL
ncbi:unnamed protein product [Chrysoparadoxa australica]